MAQVYTIVLLGSNTKISNKDKKIRKIDNKNKLTQNIIKKGYGNKKMRLMTIASLTQNTKKFLFEYAKYNPRTNTITVKDRKINICLREDFEYPNFTSFAIDNFETKKHLIKEIAKQINPSEGDVNNDCHKGLCKQTALHFL